MKRLFLPHPAPGGTMLVGAEGRHACRSLAALARVMELPVFPDGDRETCDAILRDEPPESPEFTATIGFSKREFFYREAGGVLSSVVEKDGAPQYTPDWKSIQVLASLHTLLRGDHPLFLMHGTLLEISPGEGVFLFGPSGMGKSTTMARYRAAGGECFADDAVLFSEKEGKWYASPMPTYSCCIRFWSPAVRFPFLRSVEVKALCLLDRSETKEEVVSVPDKRYLAHLSAALLLHYHAILARLADRDIALAGKTMLSTLIRWKNSFAPVSLRAHLGGDILSALEEVKREATR